MTSPWALHTPSRQPAGGPSTWKYLDLSWYDGATWGDFIEDAAGETWQRRRYNTEDQPPWTRVILKGD